MLPSGRSDSTHTRTGLCPVLAVLGPSQTHRSRGRLRLCLAGSPVARAVSSSLSFRTNLPLPAAPHPALPRRSCLPLPRALCLPEGNDFHILSSWFHGRTRRPRRGRDGTGRPRLIPSVLSFLHPYPQGRRPRLQRTPTLDRTYADAGLSRCSPGSPPRTPPEPPVDGAVRASRYWLRSAPLPGNSGIAGRA